MKQSQKDAQAEIAFAVFNNAVERLECLLEEETTMLSSHKFISLDDFNHKKRHGLLELSRAINVMRALDHNYLAHEQKALLERLRVKLENNLMILQAHLDAVRALASTITRIIQDHESDGTYTPLVVDKSR